MSRTDSTHKCAECGRAVDTLYYTPDTGWLCAEHFMTRWLPKIFEAPKPPKKKQLATGQRVETPQGLGVIWSYDAVNDQWIVQMDANPADPWDLLDSLALLPFKESEIVPIDEGGDGA